MSEDAGRFVAELDGRVQGYLQEIRDRAAATKRDLESGVLSLRSQAEPSAQAAPSFDDLGSAPEGGLDDFAAFSEPSNGAHPLDAPIFGESDSFLSDDLDFSIDLDDQHPPA